MQLLKVCLSWPEIVLAVNVGGMRRISALKTGRQDCDGASIESAWDHDINGALAECAVAKWSNVFWNGTIGSVSLPDVGKLQVRSKIIRGHRLVVKLSDKDDEIFVSALVELPNVSLCGWLLGKEAKQEKWLCSYPGRPKMYFIEDKYLHDMTELR